MNAVPELYQRVIYHQQSRRPIEPLKGEFQLRSRADAAVADQSHQELVERLSEDAPEIAALLNSTDLSGTARKNLLRFLSSAYASSERYAAVLRLREAIVRSISLFENSEYLTDVLVRFPEEVDTLAEISSTVPTFVGGNMFQLSLPSPTEDQFATGDPVFNYIANSTASHSEKIALLRRHFRHRMFASGARDLAELRPINSKAISPARRNHGKRLPTPNCASLLAIQISDAKPSACPNICSLALRNMRVSQLLCATCEKNF